MTADAAAVSQRRDVDPHRVPRLKLVPELLRARDERSHVIPPLGLERSNLRSVKGTVTRSRRISVQDDPNQFGLCIPEAVVLVEFT